MYLKGLRLGFIKARVLSRQLFILTSRKEEKGLDTLLRNEGGKVSVCVQGWLGGRGKGWSMPPRSKQTNQQRSPMNFGEVTSITPSSLRASRDFGFYHYRERDANSLGIRPGVPH